MATTFKIHLNFVLLITLIECTFSKLFPDDGITFEGCGKNGWKCLPSAIGNGKYDIEYDCGENINALIHLWSFRAPKEIYGLKISNCDYLQLDLSCGSDGQIIDSVLIFNINVVNLTSVVHAELVMLPTKFIFDQIGYINKLQRFILKQRSVFPEKLYQCFRNMPQMNSLFMTNIAKIDKIESHAIDASNMEWFLLYNVTIIDIEPYAITVYMNQFRQINFKQCYIEKMGYRSLLFRAHSLFVNKTTVLEIEKNGFCGTVYWFHVSDCLIGVVHSLAFYLLSQNIVFLNNSFGQLLPQAFNGIGPGLLENALVSFGKLRFTYVFSRNRVYQANIGSLNPDWEAYKNVKTYLNFTMNFLPCSCADLGWLNLETGIGKGLLDIIPFNRKVMERKSQNLCIDSPCLLPLSVMSLMQFVNGTCDKNHNLKDICTKFLNNNEFRKLVLKEPDKLRSKVINGFLVDENNENILLENPVSSVPVAMVNNKVEQAQTEPLNSFNTLTNADDIYKLSKRGNRYIRKTQSEVVKDEFSQFYEQYMNAKYKNLSKDGPDFVFPIKDKLPETTVGFEESVTEEPLEIEEDPWKYMTENENETSEETGSEKFIKRDVEKFLNSTNEQLLQQFGGSRSKETMQLYFRPVREAKRKNKKKSTKKPNNSKKGDNKNKKKKKRIPKSITYTHEKFRSRYSDSRNPIRVETPTVEDHLLENGAAHESFEDIHERKKRYIKHKSKKSFQDIIKQMKILQSYPNYLNETINLFRTKNISITTESNEKTNHEEEEEEVLKQVDEKRIREREENKTKNKMKTDSSKRFHMGKKEIFHKYKNKQPKTTTISATTLEMYDVNENNSCGDLEPRASVLFNSTETETTKEEAPNLVTTSNEIVLHKSNLKTSIRNIIKKKPHSYSYKTNKPLLRTSSVVHSNIEDISEDISTGDLAERIDVESDIILETAVEDKTERPNTTQSSASLTLMDKQNSSLISKQNRVHIIDPSKLSVLKNEVKDTISKIGKGRQKGTKILWHLKTDKYTWKRKEPIILIPKIIDLTDEIANVQYEYEQLNNEIENDYSKNKTEKNPSVFIYGKMQSSYPIRLKDGNNKNKVVLNEKLKKLLKPKKKNVPITAFWQESGDTIHQGRELNLEKYYPPIQIEQESITNKKQPGKSKIVNGK